jgi:hypothetical protein
VCAPQGGWSSLIRCSSAILLAYFCMSFACRGLDCWRSNTCPPKGCSPTGRHRAPRLRGVEECQKGARSTGELVQHNSISGETVFSKVPPDTTSYSTARHNERDERRDQGVWLAPCEQTVPHDVGVQIVQRAQFRMPTLNRRSLAGNTCTHMHVTCSTKSKEHSKCSS